MKCTDCGTPIRPVVAIDIDGTIADYHSHFFRFAGEWLGRPGSVNTWIKNYHGIPDMSAFMNLDKRTYRQIKLAYRQGGMKRNMPIMDHAMDVFEVCAAQDVEIWVTTTRPYLQVGNVDDDTREWLRRHSLLYDHLIYADEKYKLASAHVGDRIACVLDDQVYPEYLDAKMYGLHPILVRTEFNHLAIQRSVHTDDYDVAMDLMDAARMIIERVEDWRKEHAAEQH